MQVFLNLFLVELLQKKVYQYKISETTPETRNREVRFKIAANIAKKLSKDGAPVFSIGEDIYAVEKIPTSQTDPATGLETALLYKDSQNISGTSLEFSVKLFESETINLDMLNEGPERLINRLVDWYYRENIADSFHMENANYIGQNLFRRLEEKYYKKYKVNVNEGMTRATRMFGGKSYLLLDSDYRVTWEQSLWDNIKWYVQNTLNKNVYMADANTIRAINEHFGRTKNKPGRFVQGKNNVGEYEVLGFDFSKNPQTPGTAGNASQAEFFENAYGLKIQDMKQPLARVRVARGYHRGKENYHVPELLIFDKLPPMIKADEKFMSALYAVSKPEPRGRFAALINLVQGDPFGKTSGFATNQFVKKFVNIPSSPLLADAKVADPITVRMGEDRFKVSSHQDFLSKILQKKFHRVSSVKKISLVFIKEKGDSVVKFYSMLRSEAEEHGLSLPEPDLISVERTDDSLFKEAIKKTGDSALVLSFTAKSDDELYELIKKELLVSYGVLSQNISYEKTIDRIDLLQSQGKEREIKTILTLIAMQLCAKLGGAPWAFDEPIYEKDCPILGLDVYYSATDATSVGSCAAFDQYGEYLFSDVSDPKYKNEKIATLKELLTGVLNKYVSAHGTPQKVFIVRDGLNFTQEQQYVHDAQTGELAIIEEVLKQFGIGEYVFVMEKVHTSLRMYKKITDIQVDNPDPGTFLIGAPFDKNEMLMVSQDTYRGTAEPVLYKILKPSEPDMEKIAASIHKLCRHHWNTPAAIRIPAPARHADEIQQFIRRVLGATPHRNVLDRPFYL